VVDWRVVGPRAVLVVVLLAANVALVGAMSYSSTPYGPYNTDWDGTSDLRDIADRAGLTGTVGIDSAAYEDVPAGETTAFVVAPQSRYGPIATAQIRQFLSGGGTLVIAAESERTNALLSALDADARIGNGMIRDEQSNYRSPALPVANNVSDHRLVDDVDQVTLNYATPLNSNNASVLVTTAPTAYVDRNGNETLDGDEPVGSIPVASVERIGDGRLVVVSDASVFTNAMVDREDNEAFVRALLGNSSHALIDQSHGGPLPPLRYGLIVLRTTPLVQFGVGIAAFGLLGVFAIGAPSRIARRLRGERDGTPTVALTDAEIRTYVARQHPEWDDTRVQRVTEAIIRRREVPENDD
jgi:hypothetical protein